MNHTVRSPAAAARADKYIGKPTVGIWVASRTHSVQISSGSCCHFVEMLPFSWSHSSPLRDD